MKTTISFIIFLLLSSSTFAQETDTKFKIHSVSLAPNFYVGNSSSGFLGNLDLTFSEKRHLLKASFMAASEIDICIWGPCNTDNYYSYNLMYGREFLVENRIGIDVFAGVGFFKFQTYDSGRRENVTKNTVGIPVQSRIRFRNGKIFNVGLQVHFNVNSASSIFAIGPFFQWNFHSNKKEN